MVREAWAQPAVGLRWLPPAQPESPSGKQELILQGCGAQRTNGTFYLLDKCCFPASHPTGNVYKEVFVFETSEFQGQPLGVGETRRLEPGDKSLEGHTNTVTVRAWTPIGFASPPVTTSTVQIQRLPEPQEASV